MVGNLQTVEADLGHHAAEVRIGVAHGADGLHHLAVVEPEAGEVLVGLNAAQPVDPMVVLLAYPEHQAILFTAGLDADDNGVTVLPGLEHLRDHLRRVLEVGDDANDAVASGLQKGVMG